MHEEFYPDEGGLWTRMRRYARIYGKKLAEMDDIFGLEPGTLEYFEKNGYVPGEEILHSFELFTGRSAEELLYGMPVDAPLEVRRDIFVIKDADFTKDYRPLESIIGRLCIDRSSKDRFEYIGVVIDDDSMSGGRIFKDDIAIVRRQAVAEDGDVVIAVADGETVVRRYHQYMDDIWIDAEGPVEKGKKMYTDNLSLIDRSIRIYGKIVTVIRRFE